MFGGGHVRRRSVASDFETSPCVKFGRKRKHAIFQDIRTVAECDDGCQESPNKARIVQKPSVASVMSYKFGGERMIQAQRGLLERQSLEESCLIADGEDMTTCEPTVEY
jgi:serine/arginine repetitive matrix protein 2